MLSKIPNRVYQFEIEGRATLRPIDSTSESFQGREGSQPPESHVVEELNLNNKAIAQKIAQEVRQKLAAQYGEGIDVKAEIEFYYGSVIWAGSVTVDAMQILKAMDLAGGVIGFLAFTVQAIRFVTQRVLRHEIQAKAGPRFAADTSSDARPMTPLPAGAASTLAGASALPQTDVDMLTKSIIDLGTVMNRLEVSLRYLEAFVLATLLILLVGVVLGLVLIGYVVNP